MGGRGNEWSAVVGGDDLVISAGMMCSFLVLVDAGNWFEIRQIITTLESGESCGGIVVRSRSRSRVRW